MTTDRGAGSTGSQESVKAREQLKALAWLLDNSIRLPGGFRIGVDALVGLVPFLGDAAGVLVSAYIVSQAARLGVPSSVLLRMLINVGIEAVIGIVPVLGDVFDAAWKANQRNVQLLENHLDDPRASAGSSRRLLGGLVILFVIVATLMSLGSALVLSWIWNAVS